MTIHASLMVPALGWLLLPADRLVSSRVELHSFYRFQRLEHSPWQRPWWWIAARWLEPVRGFVGLLLLKSALGNSRCQRAAPRTKIPRHQCGGARETGPRNLTFMHASNDQVTHARALRAEILAAPTVWLPRREALVEWLDGFLGRAEAASYELGETEAADLIAVDRFLRGKKIPTAQA